MRTPWAGRRWGARAGGRRADGGLPGGRRRRPRPADVRRPQPLDHRRQRAAHPGGGEPGADHHVAGRPGRRPTGRGGSNGVDRAGSPVSPPEQPVTDLRAAVYRFPTPEPEGDGTLTWSATTAVTVQVAAGGSTGLGWTYSSAPAGARGPGPGRLRGGAH